MEWRRKEVRIYDANARMIVTSLGLDLEMTRSRGKGGSTREGERVKVMRDELNLH
jgi:hypothetical protein